MASMTSASNPRYRRLFRVLARYSGVGPVLLLLSLAGCGSTSDIPILGDLAGVFQKDTNDKKTGIAYKATISDFGDAGLQALLKSTSQLIALESKPPPSLQALHRRMQGDVDRMQAALRSEGFYNAKVVPRIDSDAAPITVTIEITPGIVYLLADYEIVYAGTTEPAAESQPSLETLGLHVGMQARGPTIAKAQQKLIDLLVRRGYPQARIIDREAIVDHSTTTMALTLEVNAGPFAHFGAARFEGLDAVHEDFARRFIAWRKGDPYDRDQVTHTRSALAATGLFDSVTITSAEEIEPDQSVPMTVALVEAKQRTFGFRTSYTTSEGIGARPYWEHRNIFGRNESLRLTLSASQIDQGLISKFRKPFFPSHRDTLIADAKLLQRNTDAFNEKTAAGAVGIERVWRPNWRATAGVSTEYGILEEDSGRSISWLFGLPVTGVRETVDDIVNPTQGTRLRLSATPYRGEGDRRLVFGVFTVEGSTYYSIDDAARYVVAGRIKIGSIQGEDTSSIPANKRFYAGGGGSIRGYAYQSVGPLDSDNGPIGGRSLLELNAELRLEVFENFAIVPFIDGGTVFDTSIPGSSQTIQWAAGLGGRYFSPVGPLRIDIATPLNRRPSDDLIQFYISLGQAF